jgi:hypothetical protein
MCLQQLYGGIVSSRWLTQLGDTRSVAYVGQGFDAVLGKSGHKLFRH